MSAAHTPGPWKAVSAAACAEIEVMEIAEISHMRVIPAAGGWPTAGTPEDDARLIAAAPDLLLALPQADNPAAVAAAGATGAMSKPPSRVATITRCAAELIARAVAGTGS